MADNLLRSTVDAPLLPLARRKPTSTDRTSETLSQLSKLGAGATQAYTAEHEKAMSRQAMNDLVNDTVNPDLELHEGAYAQTYAKGNALKSYNALHERLKSGEFNSMPPEDFQKFMLNEHKNYKESRSKSKFFDLEAEAYDNFWLQNEATITAGQAGLYRKDLQSKQTTALIDQLSELVKVPGVTADQILKATTSESYSMLSDEDIVGTVLYAAVQTGDSALLKRLNEDLHFDMIRATKPVYEAAVQSALKTERATSIGAAYSLRLSAKAEADGPGFTKERAEFYGSQFDEFGKPLFTSAQLASMVARSDGKRVKQNQLNLAVSMLHKGVSLGSQDLAPKVRQEAVNLLFQNLEQSGVPKEEIDKQMGKYAVLMDGTKIPYYESMIKQLGQFDLDELRDKDRAEEFYNQFNRTTVFLDSLGRENPMRSKYLGMHTGRYNKLKEYFDLSSGTYIEKMQGAAKSVLAWEKRVATGIPLQDVSDIDTSDAADDWLDSKKGLWADIKDIFGIDPAGEEQAIRSFDVLTKKLMQEQDMSQEDAEELAGHMLDEKQTFFGGAMQPIGKDQLTTRLGGDPEKLLKNFFLNPDMTQELDSTLGEREQGTFRDPTDYVIRLDPDANNMLILDKKNPQIQTSLPVDVFKAAAQYRTQDAGNFVNIDALWEATGEEGKDWRRQKLTEADTWASQYIYNNTVGEVHRGETYATEVFVSQDGSKVKEPEIIPDPVTWNTFTDKEKVTFVESWKVLNYEGAKGWLRKSVDVMNRLRDLSGTGVIPMSFKKPEIKIQKPSFTKPEILPLNPVEPNFKLMQEAFHKAVSKMEEFFGFDSYNYGTDGGIDLHFIAKLEGRNRTTGYVPTKDNKPLDKSGVTIGSGVDLGSKNAAYFKGLNKDIIQKLEPYLGLRGTKAMAVAKSLELTHEEARELTTFVHKKENKKLRAAFNKASDVDFDNISEDWQTVISSIWYQYGARGIKKTKFWKQVTNKDWDAAYKNLRNFGDKYETRRDIEADLVRR